MTGIEHRDVVVKVYRNTGEASSKELRAEPLPGQGVPLVKVAFPRPTGLKEGDLLRIAVLTETRRKDGTPFLRAAARKDQSITIIQSD